jgi:hypothetical protein
MPPRPAPARAPALLPEWISWLLLAAAWSPILIDLAAHLVAQPWAAYCLVFVPLFAGELRRAPRGPARPGAGWALLSASLVLELLLVGGGLTRTARPGLVLAALGMALLQGRPGPRAVALLLGFVPAPHLLVSWGSPSLELRLAQWAANGLGWLGVPALAEAVGNRAAFHAGAGSVPLNEVDGGVALACLIVGLAWYAGCQRAWSVPATLARTALLAPLALPVQGVALAIAGALVAAGVEASAVRSALDVGPWAAVVAAALLGPCRPGRARPAPATEPLSCPAP